MEEQKIPLLGEIVGQLSTELFRVLKKRTANLEIEKITMEQFGLLCAINTRKDEVIQQEMADFMGKDKSTILRLIDSLESKELVRRVPDIRDRRKNYLMVTKKGHTLIEAYLEIELRLVGELMEGIDKKDMDVFCKVGKLLKVRAQQR